jgi:multidrug efflux system outer membrane protein
MRRLLALLVLALPAAGCMMGPDFVRPETDVPTAYRELPADEESLANIDWWNVFEDPALQELIHAALENNHDLRAAYWRIEEARARYGFTRSDLFPSFTYEAGASATDPSDTPLPTDRVENYFAGAGVSWEIDLWGRLRRANESAWSELLATEWGRGALTISLVSEVSRLYFVLRDFDARLEIANRTLESRRESTELIRNRVEGGITSELDVRQAEIEEAAAAVAVPSFERSIATTENALSVLLGRSPGPIVRGATLVDQRLPVTPPAGLPSALLERRPDIREAEELLHAQMARIGAAKALRFPQLSLTGFLGFESDELSDLADGDADSWSIAGTLIGPIFEFGKNKRRVEVERARTEQAILGYESAVLEALREVEDALVSMRKLREEYDARVMQVESARQAARLSRARYDGGVTSYLEVLDTERSLFDSELNASRTLQEIYGSVVTLYAALGGGWDPAGSGSVPASRLPAKGQGRKADR